LNRPAGAPNGVVVRRGEQVEALTGEVHVKPLKVTVGREITLAWDRRLHPGDTYWLLSYVGEGSYRAWLRGEIVEVEPDFALEGEGTCAESKTCESEPDGGRKAFLRWRWDSESAVWWVKLKTKSGRTGWTREPNKFDGKDLLGMAERPQSERLAAAGSRRDTHLWAQGGLP
jgi:hypothetical protein